MGAGALGVGFRGVAGSVVTRAGVAILIVAALARVPAATPAEEKSKGRVEDPWKREKRDARPIDVRGEASTRLLLTKLLASSSSSPDLLAEAFVLAASPSSSFQRLVDVAESKVVELPVGSSARGVVAALKDVAGVVRRGNWIREVIERILAKAKENPEKFAEELVRIFKPLGKAAMQRLLAALKETRKERPSPELDVIIARVDAAVKDFDSGALFRGVDRTMLRKMIRDVIVADDPDAAEQLKSLLLEALKEVVDNSTSMEEADEQFVGEVMPILLEEFKENADRKSRLNIEQVSDLIVRIIRRLGTNALERAVVFLDVHEGHFGFWLEDAVDSKLKDARAQILYVAEGGAERLDKLFPGEG